MLYYKIDENNYVSFYLKETDELVITHVLDPKELKYWGTKDEAESWAISNIEKIEFDYLNPPPTDKIVFIPAVDIAEEPSTIALEEIPAEV